MDKFVQPYDKECMKMAMLKHEETFKEQVYELHRLYQIQKMLMKNMHIISTQNHQENICFNNNNQQQINKSNFDLEQPASNKEYKLDDDQYIVEDECEIELTLAPTSFNRRRSMTNKPKSFEPVPSFSSSSSGSSHIKRVDRITRNNTSSSSSTDRTSLKQPPWMYQVLSLKMT
uniref:uncharacterized protein LOC122588889 n=1 Tax=Erigeron canadensis TaxID=72917 RepID=UPI001CB92C03|nr:uncharacterized protein LOC122588889 [Erigeron canadensis]XP_043617045.1 uncharacterized protein LOC122588889 [Erigeron canadensis]